ncbi:hypothetical protein GCM10011575_05740 [Microlunatus endophyticus]|uniref:Uncharacterized protein n=1 Tax=Microlunatus endophyticus TaxID=1716077 RepID=A0A917S0P6_9ACTN|nr:hypothetical protein [Microlunatus endophyticus]GGL50326.1 hypothetical protein GCM10011575_05740 [Microlunatus endophyticus]
MTSPTINDDWAIFLNGSYGVGKSATLDHIADLLADAGHPFSLMDVDWYHRSWPPADPDRGNKIIEAKNMAVVWANYKSAGPRRLVISGVIAGREDLERYNDALELTVRPVRLVASPAITETRLMGRYTETQSAKYDWHAQRHLELSERLAAADLDEVIIDTDKLRPSEVATAVLRHFGYVLEQQTPS